MMVQAVAPDAHTIGAWRACSHGDAINYEGRLEGVGHAAVRALVESAGMRGFLADSGQAASGWIATLDVYDAAGARIQDYVIPSQEGWLWWRCAGGMVPTDWDCDTCDVR